VFLCRPPRGKGRKKDCPPSGGEEKGKSSHLSQGRIENVLHPIRGPKRREEVFPFPLQGGKGKKGEEKWAPVHSIVEGEVKKGGNLPAASPFAIAPLDNERGKGKRGGPYLLPLSFPFGVVCRKGKLKSTGLLLPGREKGERQEVTNVFLGFANAWVSLPDAR